ncbi:serine--tRNA ligase [bacterium]|nr:serine--tRNA ligase [bacterium]
MIDIEFIRKNPEKAKEKCREKKSNVDIDRILELDKKRRKMIETIEGLKAEQNKISDKHRHKSEDDYRKAREIKERIKMLEPELKKVKDEFYELMLKVPNFSLSDVPKGESENDNIVIERVGEKPKFNFPVKDYLTLSLSLDIIDIKRASKVSGPRFGYLKNEGAILEFALINYTLDTILKEGFIPVVPPVMIKEKAMRAMGYIEGLDKQEMYYLPQDKLYLVGTSEQSIGPYYMDEILNESDLPKRFLGFSTCFRREAGSYGRDTRGIFRVHQFDKLEMFCLVMPEDSVKEHLNLLSLQRKLLDGLKLPYRIVRICTGDLSFPSASSFDIETWFPSENKYRETHSTSNCTDFQTRRLNIRYKSKDGKKFFPHSLNGTAFAIGRIIIAILENYQQEDGSIKIPEILKKYVGKDKISYQK